MEPGRALLLWGAVWMLVCLCAGIAQAAERAITLESLLEEMVDRDRMAIWPQPAYVSGQASSYDLRSKTPNDPAGWFANEDTSQFIRSEIHQGRRERYVSLSFRDRQRRLLWLLLGQYDAVPGAVQQSGPL